MRCPSSKSPESPRVAQVIHAMSTLSERAHQTYAREWKEQPLTRLSFDNTPLYILVGISIGINRGCRQNDCLANG